MKIFFVLPLFILSLYARENPFFPSAGEVDIPISSNQVEKLPSLSRTSISLPSTARTLESVTLKYKSLDGAIHEKTLEIGNKIDWHIPIFISQNYNINSAKKKSQKKSQSKYKHIFQKKFISIYEKKNFLKLVTKDKLIRDFLLTRPHRIVCDFKGDLDLRSIVKKIKANSIVTKVRVGNHDGYYRVVIELDGYYRYSKRVTKEGYLFKFL